MPSPEKKARIQAFLDAREELKRRYETADEVGKKVIEAQLNGLRAKIAEMRAGKTGSGNNPTA